MSKTPPNRRGILFEVGAALEARDSLKNWYAANIEKIDYDDEKVLIHYRQWSHRYDEWFDWTSPYLRPMERERVQLRREGLQEDNFIPGFHVNEKVLASWSDCRFYPAKVLAVNKDASYTVKFYDGVVQTVKGIHVKPFIKERRKKLPDRSAEKTQVKKPENVKRMQENGAKEQADRVSEEDENIVSDLDEDDQKKSRIQGRNTGRRNEEHVLENMSLKEESEGVMEQIGQHNYSKSFLKKDSGHEQRDEKTEDNSMVFDSCVHFNEGMLKGNGIEEAKVQPEQKEKEVKGFPHDKKSQRQRVRGKRRLSMARRRCPSKKRKTDSDKRFHNGCGRTPELTNQRAPGNGLESEPSLLTQPSNGTSETPKHIVRKQAFHNPTRFSREPLYRVVRNQPPPVLSINLDHNPYKCSAPGCTKSFRKAKLLHYHMKYYHGDDRAVDEDFSANKDIRTDVFSQQTALNNQNGSKKRCIALSSVRIKRRSTVLPAVSTQNYQQWSSIKEKTKEKLDDNTQRSFNKERERRYMEIGLTTGVKECDRLKEKRLKDFLRIKMKKKKKMRTTTSDEESISDWSSDSCGWSNDDMDVDSGIMPSPLSCSSIASTTASRENVRCVCDAEEENNFMLQCEECLYWQHGTCMGLLEEKVPERYTCFICRGQIRGQRSSYQYWNDREWLNTGHMYGLSLLENYSQQNGKKITATHQLLGDIQHVVEVLNGLQLKINVLQSQTHPDLKLWQKPWKIAGRSRMKSVDLSDSKTLSSASSETSLHKEVLSSSFTDYISSDHCYQKPLEPRLELKTLDIEDRLYNTKTLLKIEHSKEEIQPSLHKTSSNKLGKAHEVRADGGGVMGGAQQHQWKINLLDHIEAVQEEVTHRMDFIEKELDVLENWLDCTGELEPPEPLDRLPELKHSVKQLLNKLGKVQQIALVCAT